MTAIRFCCKLHQCRLCEFFQLAYFLIRHCVVELPLEITCAEIIDKLVSLFDIINLFKLGKFGKRKLSVLVCKFKFISVQLRDFKAVFYRLLGESA